MPDQKPSTTFTAHFDDHYMRLDFFGRLIFDKCPSDQEHLVNPVTKNEERSLCRRAFADLLPGGLLSKKGKWTISLTFEEL